MGSDFNDPHGPKKDEIICPMELVSDQLDIGVYGNSRCKLVDRICARMLHHQFGPLAHVSC
jgi:hypothetical protein